MKFEKVKRERVRQTKRQVVRPWWYILKVVGILEKRGKEVSRKDIKTVFIHFSPKKVSNWNLYRFKETPFGMHSLDFLYDFDSLIYTGDIQISSTVGLTEKGKNSLQKFKDKEFEEALKNLLKTSPLQSLTH